MCWCCVCVCQCVNWKEMGGLIRSHVMDVYFIEYTSRGRYLASPLPSDNAELFILIIHNNRIKTFYTWTT